MGTTVSRTELGHVLGELGQLPSSPSDVAEIQRRIEVSPHDEQWAILMSELGLETFGKWVVQFDKRFSRRQIFDVMMCRVIPTKQQFGLSNALLPADDADGPGEVSPSAAPQGPPRAEVLPVCLHHLDDDPCDSLCLVECVESLRDDCHVAVLRDVSVREGAPADRFPQNGITLGISSITDLAELRDGDHVFYRDPEMAKLAMEHHAVVVSAEGKAVLAIAVTPRTPWRGCCLTFLDVGSKLEQGLFLMRPSVSRPRSDAVAIALAMVGVCRCWSASSFNCEDWAQWVTTGYSFSLQRMRALCVGSVSAVTLIEPQWGVSYRDVACSMRLHGADAATSHSSALAGQIQAFPKTVNEYLRRKRQAVFEILVAYESL